MSTQDSDIKPTGRITCPECRSRLDIFETPSGGRTVSVAVLSTTLEPQALERFMSPDQAPEIMCPACNHMIDPAAPYRSFPKRPRSRIIAT
jgi:DNA-directed RNA polymerase subunit RPC12/RpoP